MKTKIVFIPETIAERVSAIILIPDGTPEERQQRINDMRAEMGEIKREYPGAKVTQQSGSDEPGLMPW
jgi:hypothetical protein